MNVHNTNFSRTNISAASPEILHPPQAELTKISILNTRSYEWHGNISLNAVNASPGRYQGQDFSDKVDELIRVVVLVLSSLPELIQASTANNQRRVDLQSIRPEVRVLEKLDKAILNKIS